MKYEVNGPTATREKPRVLIVDDDALSNQAMALVLRLHGFPCLAVTSEANALAMIEEFSPDVVILEWANRMEREVESATRLRMFAETRGRRVPIIVVTHEVAVPSADVLDNVCAYFTKPVALERLEQKIETLTAPMRRTVVG